MYGALVATHTAVYSFFNQSGLSSGGTIFRFFLPPRPGPFGLPAINQAIITNQDHLGRLRIFDSSVREQSIIEKIIKAVTMMIPMTAARSMVEV
jgi:hypothetical protein